MGKGFSSNDSIFGNDDSVNGFPYVDEVGNPDDIIAPDWLTSTFSTDSNLQSGSETAIVLGDGFDPTLHLYDATGSTYNKINNPVADDNAFGGSDSQTNFFAFPGATYQAVVESVDVFPPTESRNFYFEAQVDDAGNDLFSAKDLGDLSTSINASVEDFVGVSDADDFYKFDLSTAATVDLNLGSLLGNVDIELLDGSGSVIASSFNSGTQAEQITENLDPGTYYIYAEAVNASDTARAIASNDVASNYVLDLSATGVIIEPPKTNTPTDLSLNNLSILENQPLGTTVGTLSTTDLDAGDTFTYSLVSGAGSTDNAAFEIVDNTLKTKQAFDFEAKNAYSIRVRTTDSAGLTFEKEVKLAVGDVAEAVIPTRPNPTGKPIIGTRKNDRLPGTANDDLIRGLRGDDKLNGRGGNDILVGGADDDTLKGGVGDDILQGGAGEDIYFLQNNGIDTIQAFSIGEDTLKLTGGLTFSNLVITQQGNNTLIGAGNNQFAILAGVNASQITVADFV